MGFLILFTTDINRNKLLIRIGMKLLNIFVVYEKSRSKVSTFLIEYKILFEVLVFIFIVVYK